VNTAIAVRVDARSARSTSDGLSPPASSTGRNSGPSSAMRSGSSTDVIEANRYTLHEISSGTTATRKIGMGIMGWADALSLDRDALRFSEALSRSPTSRRDVPWKASRWQPRCSLAERRALTWLGGSRRVGRRRALPRATRRKNKFGNVKPVPLNVRRVWPVLHSTAPPRLFYPIFVFTDKKDSLGVDAPAHCRDVEYFGECKRGPCGASIGHIQY